MTENNIARQKTILIVEDDKYSLLGLQKMVERLGFIVRTAINGEEALRLCNQKNQIDLILMDIKMPVMDGYEAMHEIKKLRPELKIVAQTAHAMSGDRDRIISSGFEDYIPKPIALRSLEEIFKRHL